MQMQHPFSLQKMTKERIKEMIDQRESGERLPSEEQLAMHCGVSRPTVRTVLAALEQEGFLIRRHGIGTFVVKSTTKMKASLQSLYSVADIVRMNGYEPTIADVHVTKLLLPAHISQALEQAPGAMGYRVSRVIFAEREPAVFVVDYLPQALGEQANMDEFNSQMIPFLRQRGISLAYAAADLSLERASEETAHFLDIPLGDPVLLLHQVAYTADNTPMIYSDGYHREGLVSYSIMRIVKSDGGGQMQ
ncbi:GntR family transcriptional regulator [Alicyclobacillaceae bacterium I2511]|nr:GntR family transcriptional regulator [Alicyclobacillaceae bacterium I2511]